MEMIRRLLNHLIDMRVQVAAKHPPIVAARDGVPEVADNCVDVEELAMLIPIMAP